MATFKDITGQRFGRWTAIEHTGAVHITPKGKRILLWECVCDCGTKRSVLSSALFEGGSKSCGCLKIEKATRHGFQKKTAGAKNLTYRSWRSMKTRCTNPKSDQWHRYGGRGISFQPDWADFENFLRAMGECPPGHSIDRIDPNGNYTKENCRWASSEQQSLNKTNTRFLTVDGVVRPLVALAREWGINPQTIGEQMKRGWTDEQIYQRAMDRLRDGKSSKRRLTSTVG